LGQILVKKPNDPSDTKAFSFDSTFGPESTQQSVYEQTGFQLVENVLEGYNGTIFAYGQTGCGKTFIMMGVQEDEQLKGIIPRTFSQIITMVENTDEQKKYLVRCSFLEIYNEEVHDLLSEQKSNLELKESPEKGVFIKDLSLIAVKTVKDM
jgi:kinesin family protein 3/17